MRLTHDRSYFMIPHGIPSWLLQNDLMEDTDRLARPRILVTLPVPVQHLGLHIHRSLHIRRPWSSASVLGGARKPTAGSKGIGVWVKAIEDNRLSE